MKPEQSTENDEEPDKPAAISGDVIGDTAYSERFVLKILLKFANLDTLKSEVKEKTFEDELCTLWDMTAERDVVLFLQKHDILNLINFALPVVEIPRIIEILFGIVGNMCCHKEIVTDIMKMDTFATNLLDFLKTDDSLILVQIIRMVSACLYMADDTDVLRYWMDLMISTKYPESLCFILMNSASKELIVTALENFNTICSYCNVETTRSDFYTQFVTQEALESLVAAFTEVTVTQKDICLTTDERERILLICMQVVLHLVGFEDSKDIYKNTKDKAEEMIGVIITYFDNKFVDQKEVDIDLVDILESIYTIVKALDLGQCEIDKYFNQSYNIWLELSNLPILDKNSPTFEDDKNDLDEFISQMKPPLSVLLGSYLVKCSDDDLLKAMDKIGDNYEDIVSYMKDENLVTTVSKRTEDYRTRLKESDS